MLNFKRKLILFETKITRAHAETEGTEKENEHTDTQHTDTERERETLLKLHTRIHTQGTKKENEVV